MGTAEEWQAMAQTLIEASKECRAELEETQSTLDSVQKDHQIATDKSQREKEQLSQAVTTAESALIAAHQESDSLRTQLRTAKAAGGSGGGRGNEQRAILLAKQEQLRENLSKKSRQLDLATKRLEELEETGKDWKLNKQVLNRIATINTQLNGSSPQSTLLNSTAAAGSWQIAVEHALQLAEQAVEETALAKAVADRAVGDAKSSREAMTNARSDAVKAEVTAVEALKVEAAARVDAKQIAPTPAFKAPPLTSQSRNFAERLTEMVQMRLPEATELPEMPEGDNAQRHFDHVTKLGQFMFEQVSQKHKKLEDDHKMVLAKADEETKDLAETKARVVSDMDAFEVERKELREAVEHAVGAVDDAKLQVQAAAKAKLANAIIQMQSELDAARAQVQSVQGRDTDVRLQREALSAQRQALDQDVEEAKLLIGAQMTSVQSREADVLQSMSQMEQQKQLWDQERCKLQSVARQDSDSVFDDSQTFAESQVAQLQSALLVAEGVITEQHESYTQMKARVQILEEEAAGLRVSMKLGTDSGGAIVDAARLRAVKDSEMARLNRSDANYVTGLEEQVELLRTELRQESQNTVVAKASAASAHKFAEEAVGLRVTEMRRAQESEKREKQCRLDACNLMVQEATRCEALLAAELGVREAQPQVRIEDFEVTEADQHVAASVLVFDVDMGGITDGSPKRSEFELHIQQDLGFALGIEPTQLCISSMTSPGGVLDFEIRTDSFADRTALELRDDLHIQVADEGSHLHTSGGVLSASLNPTASITALSAVVLAEKTHEVNRLRHVLENSAGRRIAEVARLQLASARAAITLDFDEQLTRLRVSQRVLEAEKCQLLAEQTEQRVIVQSIKKENNQLRSSAAVDVPLHSNMLQAANDWSIASPQSQKQELNPQYGMMLDAELERDQLLKSAEQLASRLGARAKALQNRIGSPSRLSQTKRVPSPKTAHRSSPAPESSSSRPSANAAHRAANSNEPEQFDSMHDDFSSPSKARLGHNTLNAWSSTAGVSMRRTSQPDALHDSPSPLKSPARPSPQRGTSPLPRVKKKWSSAVSGDLSQEERNALRRWNETKSPK